MNDLAVRIDEQDVDAWAERITACWRDGVEAIFAAGRLLVEAKDTLPHGQFRTMCQDNLPFGYRKAQMLMAIASDARLSNAQRVALLPPNWGALYDLTRLDDDTLDARFADGTIQPDMERRDIVQSVKSTARAVKETLLGAKQRLLPTKKYGVIYADPEWQFEVYSRDTGMDRSADNHYPTSATDAICTRPVKDIAADDCVLFLWATVPMLPDALKVMAAWGFTYKSQTVWNKDRLGTGYWFRNKHELLLVGTRGNVPAPAMGTQWPSVIDAPVGKHSEKPDRFYELIETYFPNLPKIELNARRARKGWDLWGLEAPDHAVDATKMVVASSDREAEKVAPSPASPEPAIAASHSDCAVVAGSTISERTEASSSSEPSSGAAPHSEAPHAGIGSETCAGCEAVTAGEGANALATHSDIDLEIPAFLRRQSDNSVPSVPVASPREPHSGISGEASG